MNTQYVSLAALAERLEVYERLPVPLQEGMKRSIQFTLVTNLICLPILWVTPALQGLFINDFFGITSYTAGGARSIYRLISTYHDDLLVLNVISLILVGLVLLISHGMTHAVHEPVHWAVSAAAVPSAVMALATAFVAVLSVVLFAVTLFLWILAITCVLLILGVIFGGGGVAAVGAAAAGGRR